MLKTVELLEGSSYSRYRPNYPKELFDFLYSLCPERGFAWDCCTGTGQVASRLAEEFNTVIASDNNPLQINHADPQENIFYRVEDFYDSEIALGSVDLVTMAQAFHWIDRTLFFDKMEHVLKVGGIAAVWGYLNVKHPSLNQIENKLFAMTCRENAVQDAFEYLKNSYPNIKTTLLPIKNDAFLIHECWEIEQYIGYLNSLSPVMYYTSKYNQNPVDLLQNDIKKVWSNESSKINLYWPLVLKVFIKVNSI